MSSTDHDEARDFIDSVSGTFGIVLFLVTLVGVVAAPLLVLVVAPGFVGEGGDLDLAALMLRFTFPYLFFVSLTAFAGGILNTYGRFGVPAFTPVMLNVVLIAAAIWLSPKLDEPIMALAYAVSFAGVVQLLFQLPFLAKIHALPRPKWAPQHAGVKRAFKLMIPAIFGSSAAQDECVDRRNNSVDAAGWQYQLSVLLRPPNGISIRYFQYCAWNGDLAVFVATVGE